MLRFLISLALVGLLLFILNKTWLVRSEITEFSPQDYQLELPQPSPREIALAQWGRRLFHDSRLSANEAISCSSCHKPQFSLADNVAFSQGVGKTTVNVPPLINLRWQQWFFWDGRADNLTAQAMGPLLSPKEHNTTVNQFVNVVLTNYKSQYEALFSPVPNYKLTVENQQQIFANSCFAIATFVRGLTALESPFDHFLKSYNPDQDLKFVDGFGEEEWHGFQIFIGKGKCVQCHSGPLLSDQKFHFTGLANASIASRAEGIISLKSNPYRCYGLDSCPPIPESPKLYQNSVKTPSLRNLSHTAPYFHDGSALTIREVIYRYMRPSFKAHTSDKIGNLYLNVTEVNNLERFLNALNSPIRDIHRKKDQIIALKKVVSPL